MEKYLYLSFQSSQIENPQEKELTLFQNKYKKDFEQRELFVGNELLDKFRLNSWRNPLFSQITSIIIAYENNNEIRVKYITGSEKDVLQEFANILRGTFQEYKIVCFDAPIILPFLSARLNKNGFLSPLHQDLKFHNLKQWNLTIFDLKAYYKGAGDYSFGLEEIAYLLDVDASGIIPYDEEFNYFASNDFESLKKSAIRKIEVISAVHRKLLLLPDVDNVILAEQSVYNVFAEKERDWLKELHIQKQLTPEIVKGISDKIFSGKKNPTKAEKEHLFQIIMGVYKQTDFINRNQDTKKIIEAKEKEVKSLLKMNG